LHAADRLAIRCQARNPASNNRKQEEKERSSNKDSSMEIIVQVHHSSHILGSFWRLPLSLLQFSNNCEETLEEEEVESKLRVYPRHQLWF
jgi:hypothetical protein